MPNLGWVYDAVEELEAWEPMEPVHLVWANLGLILKRARDLYSLDVVCQLASHYITRGAELCKTSEWQFIIKEGLPGWLVNLPTLLIEFKQDTQSMQEFCAVLCRLWDAEATESMESVEVKLLVAAFTSLTHAWDRFDFSIPQEIHQIVALLQCTVLTVFCAQIASSGDYSSRATFYGSKLTEPSKEIIMPGLSDAVVGAAGRTKEAITLHLAADLKDMVIGATELMLKLASMINGELKNGWPRTMQTHKATNFSTGPG
ncbi:hypothetical protein DFH09DRAFT_1091646 [Mycena vulgaris]|nr:hypothetical protein DFH09DRAFT_1091646 [Mycena vulgaris]